ncbi:MAG TPA: hypothetical protein ENK31_07180 [Nannocystis exedens]|nr:hypothetical protein [Nannocystis exedens]
MAPKDSPKPTTTDLPRRDFFRLGLGGAALVVGCGDDMLASSATDSEGSSSGTTDPGQSTTDDTELSTSSGETSSSSSSTTTTGETTVDPTTSDASTSGTTGDTTTTGGDLCGGELIEFDPASIDVNELLFPLAVMAGEMRPTSIMVAVFIADAAPKTLRIWRPSDDPALVELIHEEQVVPDSEGYTKLIVEGLCPGTWYRYGYFVGDPDNFTARSPICEVRTATSEETLETLTVAISACNGDAFDWPALDYSADEYYDMFIHLGDMAYNDGAASLEEFRTSWRKYLSVADFKKAYSRAGLYATWDDHEIDDNSNFDRETMDPKELERRQNAMDAYFELMPIDAEGPNYRLWRSFRWGLTAEFIVLDCRYERRPSIDQYISPEQMLFLKERLLNSPCHFKVVVNSVPITNMPTVWDVAANDRWEGYPEQRDAVLDHINTNNIENVWFLTGDFHVTFVSRLEPEGDDLASRTREIAITGGRENPIPEFLTGLKPPQFDYGRHKARGCIITFDPMANAVNVRFIDPETGEDVYNESLTQDL